MSKFCSNCGSPLKEGAKFCPECGTAIEKTVAVKHVKEEVKEAVNEPIYDDIQSSPTDYQYNDVDNLIEPINSKKRSKKPKIKSKSKKKEKEKIPKKKSGCLKKFLMIIGILIALFVALVIWVGNDDSTDSDTPPTIVVDGDYTALDQLTGFDFYNLDYIPCLETEDEFNEILLPYMIRGIAERYRTTEYFGDIIFSDAFIESHTDDEWYQALGAYSEMWAQVEYYAKTTEELLKETNFSASIDGIPNKFSAEYFITAYADEKIDWEEVGIYLQMAESSRQNPAKMLMANMGLSAERAKKVARTYTYQQTRQKLNYSLDKEVRKAIYQENLMKVIKYTGQGAGVVASVASFGTLNLINQVGVFLCNTDTIVDMGEQTATYLLGKNNVVSAYLLHLRDKVTSTGSTIGSILSFNPNNLSKTEKLFDRFVEGFNLLKWGWDQGSDINDGKILGVDLADESPNAFIPKDKAELLEKIRSKGIEENPVNLTDEEYENMKSNNSWIDADSDTKEAYMNKRDTERQIEKDQVNEKEAQSLMDDAIKVYDENIAGTDLEPQVIIDKQPAKKSNKDSTPVDNSSDTNSSDNNVPDHDNSNITNTDDATNNSDNDDSGPQLFEYYKACADRMNYDIYDESKTTSYKMSHVLSEAGRLGYEDLARKYNCLDSYNENRASFPPEEQETYNEETPKEFLRNDPFTARIWSRLESMNTIEDNVIDEIMSDIVWNITLSDSGTISVEQMERIFRERSPSLYNEFNDLFTEVPSVEDASSNNTSTPPTSSNNTSGDNSNAGAATKAEKKFNEFQAAKAYHDSLADGPEKDAAYAEMNIKYQLYMNALKK